MKRSELSAPIMILVRRPAVEASALHLDSQFRFVRTTLSARHFSRGRRLLASSPARSAAHRFLPAIPRGLSGRAEHAVCVAPLSRSRFLLQADIPRPPGLGVSPSIRRPTPSTARARGTLPRRLVARPRRHRVVARRSSGARPSKHLRPQLGSIDQQRHIGEKRKGAGDVHCPDVSTLWHAEGRELSPPAVRQRFK